MAKKRTPEQEAELAELVDICDVVIDRSLPMEDRIRSYVEQIKNPYKFKAGDTIVHVSYVDADRTLNDNVIAMISAKLASTKF